MYTNCCNIFLNMQTISMYVTTLFISNPYIQYVTHTLHACETTLFVTRCKLLGFQVATITYPMYVNQE